MNNDGEVIATFLSQANCNGSVTFVPEASQNWPVTRDWLQQLVGEVHLAHHIKVKVIAEPKIKTDKIDARALAHVPRSNFLPEAYVPSQEPRELRGVLRQGMLFCQTKDNGEEQNFSRFGSLPRHQREETV